MGAHSGRSSASGSPARRSQAENRERLLAAGRALFAAQGYPATTHKQIAAEAAVSTAVLYRHFGSKSQLLLESVIEPFEGFTRGFAEAVAGMDARGGDSTPSLFVADLHARLAPHRSDLRALLTALQSPDGEGLMQEFGSRLDVLIDDLRPYLGSAGHDADSISRSETALRLVIGMVTTAVVLDEWFFAPAPAAEPDHVVGVLGSMCAFGMPVETWSSGPGPAHSPTAPQRAESVSSAPGRPQTTLPDGRQRRGSSDVRQALLASATRLFSESGFSATSYRDIARAAATSESALYRHFGSKSNLLVEGVLKPFTDAFDQATRRWARMTMQDRQNRQRDLVADLYDSLSGHRQLLRVLMGLACDPQHGDLDQAVTSWFTVVFEELHHLTGQRVQVESDLAAEPELRMRAVMAMVTAVAALDDWFLPADQSIRHGEVIEVISELITLSRSGSPARRRAV